jgi:excisionase family DNA binding protein
VKHPSCSGCCHRDGTNKRLYTVPEAALYLGRTEWGIRGLIDNGRLPVVRIDRRVLIDVRDMDRIIEETKVRFDY